MDLSAFLGEFKLEALEHLERLGSGLLALERTPDDAGLLRKLFLSAHTIKGGASMLELRALKNLTHAFEDVLARLRDTPDRADSATVTLLLRALDEIKTLVEHDPTRASLTPELDAFVGALRARARGETVAVPASETPATPEAPVEPDPEVQSSEPVSLETVFHETVPLEPHALVLEPSDTARVLLRLQLEERGWRVTDCADAPAVLDAAHSARLAVVPVEPGGTDGFALAQALRGQSSTLEIVLSALGFTDDEHKRAEGLQAKAITLTAWNANPFWSPGASWSSP
jgi:chemotaxis protein histidine kinase CheA